MSGVTARSERFLENDIGLAQIATDGLLDSKTAFLLDRGGRPRHNPHCLCRLLDRGCYLNWCLSHRADPAAKALADRHYNRQKPWSAQFVPPGSCLVLLTPDAKAFWVTSAPIATYVKHAWAGAWVCSAFRSEDAGVASILIRSAVAATKAHYGEPPSLGMITFIDRDKVKPTMVRGHRTWGWTWRKAGFVEVGETKGGLLAMQLWPDAMPDAEAALPRSMHGTSLFDYLIPA